MDKQHNEPGTPFLAPDAEKESAMRDNMREEPYVLDAQRRDIVLRTILEVASHRDWTVLACHVRSTHVHVIVSVKHKPEKIMSDFKAYASRRLKEQMNEPPDHKRWTQHGSTVYLWNEHQLVEKIDYVLHHQGAPMAVYDGTRSSSALEVSSEPEA
jgi:REP element-mobilizing transposase RayT